jgi:hypothetical protein
MPPSPGRRSSSGCSGTRPFGSRVGRYRLDFGDFVLPAGGGAFLRRARDHAVLWTRRDGGSGGVAHGPRHRVRPRHDGRPASAGHRGQVRCAQNWYIPTNVSGLSASNSCQQSRSVIVLSLGNRLASVTRPTRMRWRRSRWKICSISSIRVTWMSRRALATGWIRRRFRSSVWESRSRALDRALQRPDALRRMSARQLASSSVCAKLVSRGKRQE